MCVAKFRLRAKRCPNGRAVLSSSGDSRHSRARRCQVQCLHHRRRLHGRRGAGRQTWQSRSSGRGRERCATIMKRKVPAASEQSADTRMRSGRGRSLMFRIDKLRVGTSKEHTPQAHLREAQRQAAQQRGAAAAPPVLPRPLLAPLPLGNPPLSLQQANHIRFCATAPC